MTSLLKVDEIQDAAGKKILQNTGSVLQIKHVVTAAVTSSSSASGTFADITGLTLDITPTNSNNQLLIMTSVSTGSNNWGTGFRILKDGSVTDLIGDNESSNRTEVTGSSVSYGSNDDDINTASFQGVITAGTTDQITIKVQGSARSSNAWKVNAADDDSNNTSRQRACSSLVVMEISA